MPTDFPIIKKIFGLFLQGASGRLELVEGIIPPRCLWLMNGFPLAAEMGKSGTALADLLSSAGAVSPEQLAELLAVPDRSDDKLAEAAVQKGLLSQIKLATFTRRKAFLDFAAFCLSTSESHFYPSSPPGHLAVETPYNLFEVLLYVFQNHTSPQQIEEIEKAFRNFLLSPSMNLPPMMPSMQLPDQMKKALAEWKTPRSLNDFMAVSGLSYREAVALVELLRIVDGLTLSPRPQRKETDVWQEMAAAAGHPAPASDHPAPNPHVTVNPSSATSAAARPATRAFPAAGTAGAGDGTALPAEWQNLKTEIEKRLQTIETNNPFTILGVGMTAPLLEVKAVYLDMVKRLHPDKLANSPLAYMMPDCSKVFAAIGSAYRLLVDPKQRVELAAIVADPLLKGDMKKAEQKKRAALEAEKTKIFFRKREYKNVISQANLSLAIFSSDPDVLTMKAWAIYNVTSERNEALTNSSELINRALELNPACEMAHYYRGMIAHLNRDNETAVQEFEWVLMQNPQHLEAKRELSLLRAHRGK